MKDDLPHRSCGTCSLCCVVMGIEELKKPAMVPCQFVVDHAGCGGCKIYGQHPPSCQEWYCMWQGSMIPEELDPLSTGLVFTLQTTVDSSQVAVMVKQDPRRRGVWRDNPRVVGFMEGLSYKLPVMVGCYTNEVIFWNGQRYDFTPEDRALMQAGGVVRVFDSVDVRDAGEPAWLRE